MSLILTGYVVRSSASPSITREVLTSARRVGRSVRIHHQTRLVRASVLQTDKARWHDTSVVWDSKVDDDNSLVALEIRQRIHLDLR